MDTDRFVVEIARVYKDHTVPVGQRSYLATDSLAQANLSGQGHDDIESLAADGKRLPHSHARGR
jgi:hypothetical protein